MSKKVLEDVILLKREMSTFLFSVSMWRKLLIEYKEREDKESLIHSNSRFAFFEHCCIALMRMWDGGEGSLSFFKIGEYLAKEEFIDFLNDDLMKRMKCLPEQAIDDTIKKRERGFNEVRNIVEKYRRDRDIFLDVKKRNKNNNEEMIKELKERNVLKMFITVLLFRNKLYAHVDKGSFIDGLDYGYIGVDYFDEIKKDMSVMLEELSEIFGDGSSWSGESEARMYDEDVKGIVIP